MEKIIIPKESRDKMPDWFSCRICSMIMLHVYQLVCGHLVCKSCKEKLEKDHVITCLDDPSCLNSDTSYVSKIFEDRCQGRTIRSFKTECINAQLGCSWFGELKDYMSHYEECKAKFEESMEVQDSFCEISAPLKVKSSVPLSIQNQRIQSPPINMATDALITCPYCQSINLPPSELQNHLDIECSRAEIPCPFTEVGCPEHQRQPREILEEHKRIVTEVHLDLLLRDHLSLQRVSQDESQKLFTLMNQFRQLTTDTKGLSTNLAVLSSDFNARCHQLDRTNSDILSQLTAIKLNPQRSSIEHLETRLNNIEAMLACFQEDRVTGTAPAGNLEQRISALERTVENVAAQEQRILTLERQLDFKNSRVESLEEQLSGGDITSYDGILLWRITDVMRKRRDAITKRKTYILSPPFFSGPRGYKMCIRVYLNGDGQGKGTHLSVFFTILKGPYDALLPWPFKQIVHLSALSQIGSGNVEDSFRPDPNSVSFQRPKKEANISSGCPLFLPLQALENEGYIQDDCLFLKAKVDAYSL